MAYYLFLRNLFSRTFLTLLFFFNLSIHNNSFSQQRFNSTGVNVTYLVPQNVYAIQVYMWGAGGGGGDNTRGATTYGGGGGFVEGTLCVTPGESLTIIVGKGGLYGTTSTSNSYGGGGAGGNNGNRNYTGQGGGRSAIRRGTTELVTAGGGGGGGETRDANSANVKGGVGGAGGGLVANDGANYNIATQTGGKAGRGGTQTSGGQGGLAISGDGGAGDNGTQFFGGNGNSLNGRAGGGGGGGFYGGGGGGGRTSDIGSGGGGGGSSYIGGLVNSPTTIPGGSGILPNNSQQNAGNASHSFNNNQYGRGGFVNNNGQDGLIVLIPITTTAGPDKAICDWGIQLDGSISTPNNLLVSSTINWSGGPISSGSTSLTPFVNPTVTTTYTISGTVNGCNYSDNATITVTPPVGDTSVYGQNMWNVYAYHAYNNDYNTSIANQYLNLDPNIIGYRGFYTDASLDINTTNKWPIRRSPSSASNYQGCLVNDDYHVYTYKRQGFPCGTYKLVDFEHDDIARIIIDGVTVYNSTTCCSGTITQSFLLDGRSKVEIRAADRTGDSFLKLKFVQVANQLSNNGDARTCFIQANSGWNTFTLADGKTIAQINPGASTLGYVTATSFVSPTPLLVDACLPVYDHQTAVLGRRWTINPDFQPTNAVSVRLFFSNTEHTDLIPYANSSSNPNDQTTSISDLKLSKYHHPQNIAVNHIFDDNCANIPNGNMSIYNAIQTGTANGVLTGFNAIGRFAEYSITNFSEFWLHGSLIPSPLAVDLVDFSAVCDGKTSVVKWSTLSELNADYFVLEQSTDGIEWNEFSKTKAVGNTSNTTNYHDRIQNENDIYLRLSQIDFNGETRTYSPIYLKCGSLIEGNSVKITPNPNQGKFTISLEANETLTAVDINVSTLDGKSLIVSKNHTLSKGINHIGMEADQLAAGTYLVYLLHEGGNLYKTLKMVIQ